MCVSTLDVVVQCTVSAIDVKPADAGDIVIMAHFFSSSLSSNLTYSCEPS